MRISLLASMLRLVYPPRSTKADQELVAALERHNAATRAVNEKAKVVDRALANIAEAADGLFT